MTDKRQAKLYETQKSLTEWLEDIKHKDAAVIRAEDNDKRERLKVLKSITGLPFDEPVKFEATDLRDKQPAWQKYVDEHGAELCALRLIPKDPALPKLRMRGHSVKNVYKWFLEQKVEAEKYRAEYIPHAEKYDWSTIFVINQHGIQGEIIKGAHYQLTQGFLDEGRPITFLFDFKTWQMSEAKPAALRHLKQIAAYLHADTPAKRQAMKQKLGGRLAHDYLTGYFETVTSPDFGLWFVDYSPSLGKLYSDMVIKAKPKAKVKVSGMAASPGQAEGPVQIVLPDKLDVAFPAGAVLVCSVTTPDYVPLMQKAAAIVTDQGGILSHAAIVARELKKPCVVGTGNATEVLKNGQKVRVDADSGVVT